jgi:putative resolvase
VSGVRLADWARANGVHPKTAYRWWRAGTLPVPAHQVNSRVILVDDPGVAARAKGDASVGLYARCHHLTSAPTWTARFEAGPSAQGRGPMVLEPGEVDDDLVGDMTEVLTGFWARPYGRRSAKNRAEKARRWPSVRGPMALS